MSIIVDDDSENSELEIPSEIIGGRYLINDESRLGAGGFGQIYLGFDQHNEDLEVMHHLLDARIDLLTVPALK